MADISKIKLGNTYYDIKDVIARQQLAKVDVLTSYTTFEEFGAVGDGVTDDTTAINNALSSSNNNFVLGVNKTYLISAPIVISHDNTNIIGNSGSCIKLKDNSYSTCYSMIVYDSNTKLHHVKLSNFTLDGNRENNIDYGVGEAGNEPKHWAGTCLALINFTNVDDLEISNMTIKNSWAHGIWLSDCARFNVVNNKIYDYRVSGVALRNNTSISGITEFGTVSNNIIDGGVIGIESVFGVESITIANNVCFNNYDYNKFPSFAFAGTYPNVYPKFGTWNVPTNPNYISPAQVGDGAGIEFTGNYSSSSAVSNNGIAVTGNTCSYNEVGIRCEEESRTIAITGNSCVSNRTVGILVFSSNFNTISSNTLSENGEGIQIKQLNNLLIPDDCTVIGNIVSANKGNGIYIHNSRYCAFVGNILSGNNTYKSSNNASILIDGSCFSLVISDNVFTNYYGDDVNGIKAVGNSYDSIINGNKFTNITNPIVLDLNANSVVNNSGYPTAKFGMAYVPSGSTSVVVSHGLPYAPWNGELVVSLNNAISGSYWVNGINATSFTFNLTAAQQTDTYFTWKASKEVVN